MSVYAVNLLCRDVLLDPVLRERLNDQPDAAFEQFGLSHEERALLRGGDVRALYDCGVNAFLLGNLPRFALFGLTNRLYNIRIRGEAG